MDTVDVAIIGYGPVGATLANLLAGQGVRVTVLERDAAPYSLPRAVHFDDEVMRVFQATGLAEQIAASTHVSPGMRFINADGALLIDWPRPMQVGPLGWHASYRFHQPTLERVLRAGVARYANARVRLGVEVERIEPSAEAVALTFSDLANGATEQTRASYVIGCDGARSLTRRAIGGGLEDLGSHERWLVLDLVLKRPMPELGDWSIQYCDPAGPATYVRGVGERRRWEIMLRAEEDAASAATPEQVWPRLARWITAADAVLERAAVYTFHAVIAERWRDGRLLIAGDAAHQTPPFLGQGMCAGIRDAANLAWKLARAVRGLSEPAILDSYQSERAPHVREYIELAVKLGGIIQTADFAAAAERDAAMLASPTRMASIKPRLGPGLHCDAPEPAGRMAPQPVIADGRRLDDAVGPRYALLCTAEFAAAIPSDVREALRVRDVALIGGANAESEAWMASSSVPAMLLRPDRYVLAPVADIAALRRLAAVVP
jgi:3-(3-hydroxy-phenyl)propionate hydroxylase